jgi:two-component system CheB/CheR fusion protein
MSDSNKSKAELIEELAALRESEEACRLFLDAMGDALMVLDTSKKVIEVNQAALDLWGYGSKGEMLNRPFVDYFPEQFLKQHYTRMEVAVRTGEVIPFETVVLTKDGQEVVVMLSGTAMRDAGGDLRGFVGVFRDITKLKRLEATLKHLTAMERQKLRSDLHDGTNQLLAGARLLATGLSQRLSTTHSDAAACASEIAQIVGEVQVSVREVAEGLDPLPAEPEALALALRELAYRTRDIYGIPCRLTSSEPVLIEDTDAATQLYLIAQEAVANAAKHAQAGRIDVTLSEQDEVVRLVVKDDGIGFPEESRNEGMGLGIMRDRSEKIGASFDVDPRKAGGTVVTCSWKKNPRPE